MEELSEMNIINNCVHNIGNRNIWPIIVFIFQTYYMVKRLTRNITSNVWRINNIERKALTILEILNDMCMMMDWWVAAVDPRRITRDFSNSRDYTKKSMQRDKNNPRRNNIRPM